MLSREGTLGQSGLQSLNSSSSFSRPSTRGSTQPPFALDDDYSEVTDFSRSSLASRGYREGGPKEARLRRVAFLSMVKEVDHLHPIKVENIPPDASEESLNQIFSQFGEVGDIYIPKDFKTLRPKSKFAIVRYKSPEAKERILSSPTLSEEALSPTQSQNSHTRTRERLSVSPVKPQPSFFTKGTGYHGICNIPVEEGYDRRPMTVQQDIKLSSCLSRSGYPWGSVRELKFLAPHLPQEAVFSYAIRVDNLPRHLDASDIQREFERFGKIVAVNCPKPLVVTQQIKDSNDGFAFVRFEDPRDRKLALYELEKGHVKVDGQVIRGKEVAPQFWPTEQTRRYY